MLSYTSLHPINLNKKHIKYVAINPIITRVKITRNEVAFCRTNVMADYIEKFTNDINVVSVMEQDDPDDHSCKYIAMINCIIIIVILIFMFIDSKED